MRQIDMRDFPKSVAWLVVLMVVFLLVKFPHGFWNLHKDVLHHENFHDFFQQLNHTSCPLSMDMLPYGMITPEEVCFLYKCGLMLDGPFLEQGSFGGLSTVALAMGIRDSGVSKTLVSFDIYPLSPELHESYPNIPNYFEKVRDGAIEHIWGSTSLKLSNSSYNQFVPVSASRGGQFHYIYDQIAKYNLFDYVFLGVGRAIPALPYQVVWSDCAHDDDEVSFNAEFWKNVRRKTWGGRTSDNVLFAFHDTYLHSSHARILRTILQPTREEHVAPNIVAYVSPTIS